MIETNFGGKLLIQLQKLVTDFNNFEIYPIYLYTAFHCIFKHYVQKYEN